MPTYDYHCETCGRDFEAYRSFTDDSMPKCPGREDGSCASRGKGKVTKLLSVPAISFRGDGFYKNDSRTSSMGTSQGSSSSDAKTSESPKKDSTSSDSSDKKAAKADKKSETKKAASSDAT